MAVNKSKGSPAEIDHRVKRLLTVLKDGRWHDRFPQRALSAKLIEACVYQGWVKRKLTKIKGTRKFRGSFKITGEGRQALKKGEHPTDVEINFTMRYDV